MNKLILTTLTSAMLLTQPTVLCASSNGVFAGFGLGVSSIDDFNDSISTKDAGFAGRVFGGYKFNDYFGVELGYAKFDTQNYVVAEYPWITFDYKLAALSLLGKLYLPLTKQFNINVSLGGAKMFTDVDATSAYESSIHYKDSSDAYVFTAGVGTQYSFTEHVALNLDLLTYGEKESDYSHFGIPANLLFTVGLNYKF